jgi:putative tryptophan/tyrosine transport system substrate-binding protein
VRRRAFITLLGGAAVAWPLPARAQQAALPVIGFFNGQSPGAFAHLIGAFHRGLNETGYIEGQNVTIEYRWGEGYVDRLPALARDLVRRQVAVIVAAGGAHLEAKAATSNIPIVFTTPGEPVKEGLVASFNHPGGNATGVSVFTVTLEAKRFELLHELVPKAATIGVLLDPTFSSVDLQSLEVHTAARATGHEIRVLNVSTDTDIDEAFSNLVEIRAGGLVVSGNPFLNSKREKLIALAARDAIPTIYEPRESTIAGGLMNYGPSITDVYRQLGVYTGRILKGEKPADLPVLQPAKFDLLINLKTAKVLGIEVPPTLLARADEVIE